MHVWLILILLSALVGGIATRPVRGPLAIVIGAAADWFGMLAWLLFNEYVLPYRGGGASMWLIAQLFGGTVAAIVAGVTAGVVVSLRAVSHREKTDSET